MRKVTISLLVCGLLLMAPLTTIANGSTTEEEISVTLNGGPWPPDEPE